MKFLKKCPVFALLLSTGVLFTIIALGGKKTIYAQQEYDPLGAPLLSVMFTGVKDDIYPWQIFTGESTPVMASGAGNSEKDLNENEGESSGEEAVNENVSDEGDMADGNESGETGGDGNGTAASGNGEGQEDAGENPETGDTESVPETDSENSPEGNSEAGSGAEGNPGGESGEDQSGEDREGAGAGAQNAGSIGADALHKASDSLKDAGFERLAPLRESTHEEYINHISADIYGDAGVIRAATYAFETVDESYFDDALFIGDSRFVGLKEYTDLADHADFCCETSLTIYKALEERFSGVGTVPEALENKDYGKIYMMLGINELGRGTTEDFMGKYTEVVDTLRELEPDAKIFIMGIMRVSGKKSGSDAIFNNGNINARNNAIATLADNKHIFYIDVNEVVCDEEGNLEEEYTFDQIHLLGAQNVLVKEFLLGHGVVE